MGDILGNLALGVQTAFSLHNLLYLGIGVVLGNLVGVLPGIGALAAIAMLLPVTYGLDPTGSLLMLAGLYYGTSFGGATTSILLNLPGTPTHAVTCIDGNPMARSGRGGSAIFMAMFASFCGVCFSIVLMAFFTPLLADAAFSFGPSEYFSLMLMGLLAASGLSSGSPVKGVASVFVGLILGTVGTDVNSGVNRFDFGLLDLQDGLSLVALAMGLFGVADIFANAGILGDGTVEAHGKISSQSIRPSREEMRQSAKPIGRGSILGFLLGVLPGTGGTIASFMSYAMEKKLSRTPKRFGHGAIEGVAGPESANSSAAISAFVPTLTLGIPGDPVMALMLGALMIHNITPGPQLITEHPTLFWGLIVSFWLGNLLLMLLNIPLIGMWIKLLSVPYRLIFPIVILLIAIGVYSENNSLFDVGVVLAIGVLGYLLSVLKFQPAPLLMGFVLGPMMEENFRRALILSQGDPSVFFTRPLSGSFMAVTILILALVAVKRLRQRRGSARG